MKKILIAEDDTIMRSMMTDFLEHWDFEVTALEDGDLAWEHWNNYSFDILITDINMPRMNGIELLKRVREQNINFPVIVMTGVPLESAKNKAIEYGATELIYKPFKMLALLNSVNNILKG